MSNISDKITRQMHSPVYGGIERLRYFADYGYGFYGLFKALFEGNPKKAFDTLDFASEIKL